MTSLIIIAGLSIVVDLTVAYLGVGIALLEFKGIELPLIKRVYKENK